MKRTLEEAAREELNHSYANKYVGNGMFEYGQQAMINMFIRGAIWQEDQAIEILSSVLENWVHGGDADCIIAEFEKEDVKEEIYDQREGYNVLFVTCPCCGSDIGCREKIIRYEQ